jgi:hypothetical protein
VFNAVGKIITVSLPDGSEFEGFCKSLQFSPYGLSRDYGAEIEFNICVNPPELESGYMLRKKSPVHDPENEGEENMKMFCYGCVVETDDKGAFVKEWVPPMLLHAAGNNDAIVQLTRKLPTEAPVKNLRFLADKMPEIAAT